MNRRQPNEDKGGPVGTAALPPHLLRLFAPRPPLPFADPLDQAPGHAKGNHLTPISHFLDMLKGHDTDFVPTLSIAERKKQKVYVPDRTRLLCLYLNDVSFHLLS